MNKSALLQKLKYHNFPQKILDAFAQVRREDFIPDRLAPYAYEDLALPLADGSTISQPYTIAFMLNLLSLEEGQKILEIGSGSGYALALISAIIKKGKIYGIEINKTLAISSKKLLANYPNISIFNKSGFVGLTELAPFDRILISASFKDMRIPYNLLDQLAENGIMIAPVKSSIFKLTKKENKIEKEEFPGFSFVPFKEE